MLYFIKNDKLEKEGYKYVIYRGGCYLYHLFSSNSEKAFKRIIRKLKLQIDHIENNGVLDIVYYKQELVEGSFWNKRQLPKHARKIKLLSNGDIVNGYVLTTNDKLYVFRPNPNAKKVFKPLPLKKHIKYQLKYGTF